MNMNKYLAISAFLGAITIVLGAFGAHALKDILSANQLTSFETAVRYQMYHVIVLLFVNIYNGFSEKQKHRISTLFIIGILFFSGSIYAITLGVSAKAIWFITPFGGLILILGWLLMGMYFFINNKNVIK
ncbi:Uncharacterized membrane protein YgdD, TMEM256/DUF423 family [Lutibacter maritimus]|uniref:Uncharacterized membrane protein YgdD, TMEM256/DUF423 family n=2 Tax=Lutibacter maritimus TaxID=593133 RepID=A0A1I6R165_9FLAO|nr:Uncharacterized membrane protein YgdD, TMEM256/DUF423 family [Lutibacter maritimus]